MNALQEQLEISVQESFLLIGISEAFSPLYGVKSFVGLSRDRDETD